MTYEELKEEIQKYPDTMNNMERMKGYAMGQVVDRIPFSVAGGDTYASIYGYTQKQYRESLDVQFDVAERAKKDFCGSGMYANTGLGLRGIGEAVGSTAVYPENDFDYLTDFILKEKVKLARNLLSYSPYSYIEIATYLGFSSQIHLEKVFKKYTGMIMRSM